VVVVSAEHHHNSVSITLPTTDEGGMNVKSTMYDYIPLPDIPLPHTYVHSEGASEGRGNFRESDTLCTEKEPSVGSLRVTQNTGKEKDARSSESGNSE
jgi:hypothetical protein